MKGSYAFDPSSGAGLTDEQNWVEKGGGRRPESDRDRYWNAHASETGVTNTVPCRMPDRDDCAMGFFTPNREGALTNGELHSQRKALLSRFIRLREKRGHPDDRGIVGAASLAFYKLKSGRNLLDTVVWYCATERLARQGYWSTWMNNHVSPRCPYCQGTTRFRLGVSNPTEVVCVKEPNRHGDVTDALRKELIRVYNDAFDAEIEELRAV